MRPPLPKYAPGPSQPGPSHSLGALLLVAGLLVGALGVGLVAVHYPVVAALLLAGAMVLQQLRRELERTKRPGEATRKQSDEATSSEQYECDPTVEGCVDG